MPKLQHNLHHKREDHHCLLLREEDHHAHHHPLLEGLLYLPVIDLDHHQVDLLVDLNVRPKSWLLISNCQTKHSLEANWIVF